MKKALGETERKLGEERGRRTGWWDEEYREKKREVRRELRKWRRGRGSEEEYKRGRWEYEEMCVRKRKEENERWKRMAMGVKRENEVWEIVNRERRRGKRINEEIEMEEWREYFMRLMGGVEGRIVRGGRERVGEDGKGEISREEIREAVSILKDGKASGMDGVPSEVWKYGGEVMGR